jgi:hypothetical protein
MPAGEHDLLFLASVDRSEARVDPRLHLVRRGEAARQVLQPANPTTAAATRSRQLVMPRAFGYLDCPCATGGKSLSLLTVFFPVYSRRSAERGRALFPVGRLL